jgi:drug/metabolite transporter (DMT)-like permease
MMAVRKSGARARGLRKVEETDLGFTWGMLNSVLLGLGAAVLVAGYIALSKGDITLAPLLLVSGYCGLIPASLLIRGRNQGSGE